MIFIQGQDAVYEQRGWSFVKCERCERMRAFQVASQFATEHIYFIQSSQKYVGDFITWN